MSSRRGRGLDVLLGDVARPAGEERGESFLAGGDHVDDGQRVVGDAEVLRHRRGVVAAVLAGDDRGQADADDVLRTERLGGDDGGEGGVDAAGEAEQGLPEAGLVA